MHYVHELHVWQLTEAVVIGSCHVVCSSDADFMKLAPEVKAVFHRYGVHSTTIQPEFTRTRSALSVEEDMQMHSSEVRSSRYQTHAHMNGQRRERGFVAISFRFRLHFYSADRAQNDETCRLLCTTNDCQAKTCCAPRNKRKKTKQVSAV